MMWDGVIVGLLFSLSAVLTIGIIVLMIALVVEWIVWIVRYIKRKK